MKQHNWKEEMKAGRTWLSVGVSFVVLVPGTVTAQLSPGDIAALKERGKSEGWTFTVAESDATRRPLHELCGAVEPPDWRSTAVFDNRPAKRDFPTAFDWRDYGGCTPIRDQDGCGSCWAFGAMGTVESMLLINESLERDLSEQWLVSCTGAGSCGGGWHTTSYNYLKISGIQDPCGHSGAVLEADFPYEAWNAPCGCPYPHPHSIFSWAVVGPMGGEAAVEQIKQAILDHGPVSTGVYVNSAFQAYDSGVFNACEYGGINHVVDLVGWDDNLGTEGVWILRNSWNTWWGEDGYMLIEYGCCRVGYTTCYVNYDAQDCNANEIADRCDVDCETPGGICDVAGCGLAADCNGNRIPDECDLSSGTSTDYNGNGAPDECDMDCNTNGVPDECDLSCSGACGTAPGCGQSADCQPDLIPDDCQILGAHVDDPPPSCTASADYGSPWCDDFEGYPLGTISGNNWEGWGGDPGALGTVTNEQNHTLGGSKSLRIEAHDTVRVFAGYDVGTSGYWVFRAYVYIPSTMTGDAFFIVNPDYVGGGSGTTWAVQVTMNAQNGVVSHAYGGQSLALVTDAWVEIRCEINFVDDLITVYYGGSILAIYPWTMGGGSLGISAVDLFSADSSGFYYDDLSLFPAVGNDSDENGIPDGCLASLTFVEVDPQPGNCYEADDDIGVDVLLGPTESVINGAQMTVLWDATCLEFVSMSPGGSEAECPGGICRGGVCVGGSNPGLPCNPYIFELYESLDIEGPGSICYAVGVDPFTGLGVRGDAVVAHIMFTKIGICNQCILSFGGEELLCETYLTDDQGGPVEVVPQEGEPILDQDDLSLEVPDDVVTNVDYDELTAVVTWDPPISDTDCDGATLVCEGAYPDDSPIPQNIVMYGGEFPIGTSTFNCTATSDRCGQQISDEWSVTVCSVAQAPAAESTVPDVGSGTRDRYLAFLMPAGVAGHNQALRVTFADLPLPFEYAEGRAMWVGQPVDVSEDAGKSDATPPTFKLSGLQCDPFFTDWTLYGTVYVRSESLVPLGVYNVQAVNEEGCSPGNEDDFSDPLSITLSKWGDAVGSDNQQSPQGTVDFNDISSVVDKFKNVPGAPAKSRADVAPSLPDMIVDFQDISSVVDAFRGVPYPYPGPPVADPCG